jgi:hypothetical protein
MTPKKGACGGRRWTVRLPRANSGAAAAGGSSVEESELEPLPGEEEGPLK